jgi:hypothetical protein
MIITTLGVSLYAISVSEETLSVIVMTLTILMVAIKSEVANSLMLIAHPSTLRRIAIDMDEDQFDTEQLIESYQISAADYEYDDCPELEIEHTYDFC